jgi:two-component system phosphate regulon response regulator PhoB
VSGDVATGPLLIQLGPGRVFVDGVETALSAVEYTLLAYLAVRLGDLCWAADILDATWGRGWAATPEYGRQVVRVHVHRLRVKLGAASGLVENEVGRGYRLADAPLS